MRKGPGSVYDRWSISVKNIIVFKALAPYRLFTNRRKQLIENREQVWKSNFNLIFHFSNMLETNYSDSLVFFVFRLLLHKNAISRDHD